MQERSAALAAVFEPVASPSTFEETVARLGTAIRVGLLAPDTRLPPERELAEQLGISRSTLRHALTTLVQSGLLAASRGRGGGTFVVPEPPLTTGEAALPSAAHAVLDFRVAIETGAAVLAAERRDAVALETMAELVERMADVEDFDSYRRADIRFHIGIAEVARSPRLVAAMTEVQGQMSELISLIPHPAQVLTHSNEQHVKLLGLLADGDAAGSVGLLRKHLEGTEHILQGLMVPR